MVKYVFLVVFGGIVESVKIRVWIGTMVWVEEIVMFGTRIIVFWDDHVVWGGARGGTIGDWYCARLRNGLFMILWKRSCSVWMVIGFVVFVEKKIPEESLIYWDSNMK